MLQLIQYGLILEIFVTIGLSSLKSGLTTKLFNLKKRASIFITLSYGQINPCVNQPQRWQVRIILVLGTFPLLSNIFYTRHWSSKQKYWQVSNQIKRIVLLYCIVLFLLVQYDVMWWHTKITDYRDQIEQGNVYSK